MTIHLSLSGGMDSSTLLAQAVSFGESVAPVAFQYGQRHQREVRSAAAVADYYGLTLDIVRLPHLTSESLTGSSPVPHGHYTDESMAATVVQGRNLLFATMLVCRAQPGDQVWLGVHAGDHAVYPDCRPEFVEPLRTAVLAAYGVTLQTPFIDMSKAAIGALGAELGVPYRLTWSCYEGNEAHCGRCGTCVERAEAFHLAGVDDPTVYADPDFWRAEVAAHV